jgi:beta-glucosidase/6-phospho-beta-glucosidase/beta-galactosidase
MGKWFYVLYVGTADEAQAIFDNFEWSLGTSVRFGLQYVNYTSLERTPKASVFQFLNWFKEHEETGNATMRMV